jgi:hypothetical protein
MVATTPKGGAGNGIVALLVIAPVVGRFWGRSGGDLTANYSQREMLKARPQAEQACQEAAAVDRSAARNI